MQRLIVGISGASGAIYGIRLIELLQDQENIETHLVMSETGKMNVGIETKHTIKEVEALADVVHRSNNLAASISSGSFRTDGMVVAPCSMKTLSGIVNSSSSNLLIRAADVVLKEQRKLVLMPREAPLHLGHCRLLYEAAQMGAVIAPPMPAFYNSPATIDDIINHSVGRVLDLLDLEVDIVRRWSGMKTKTRSL